MKNASKDEYHLGLEIYKWLIRAAVIGSVIFASYGKTNGAYLEDILYQKNQMQISSSLYSITNQSKSYQDNPSIYHPRYSPSACQ